MICKKNLQNSGVSLLSLVITIVVVIILATITLTNNTETIEKTDFTKFASEISDFSIAAYNDYAKRKSKNSIAGKVKSDSQIFYEIASGKEALTPIPVGTVAELEIVSPEKVKGNKYYYIENDKNIENWNNNKKYFYPEELHYITDKGDVFILPGFLVEEDNIKKWYVNENSYYVGEMKLGKKPQDIVTYYEDPSGEGILDVLTAEKIKNSYYINNPSISMVLQEREEESQVPIPVGFNYSLGTGDTGLVIECNGSEFVWIPVYDISSMFDEGECSLYGNVGVTTSKYGTGSTLNKKPGETGFKEPDIIPTDKSSIEKLALAGFEGSDALQNFAKEMVHEFEAMIESVRKYGGFYIGRYELGYDSGFVCRPGVKAVVSKDGSSATGYGGPETANWWGLYKCCKNLTLPINMGATMLWGCQLDAIKAYMGSQASNVSNIIQDGERRLTGQYGDEVKHIVDFRGNLNEWTMTATPSNARNTYGGNYSSPSLSATAEVQATAFRGYLGARPQLYIK